MNELYAVIAVFVLTGLLVSRMKREERNVRRRARHSNAKDLAPAPETLKSQRHASREPFIFQYLLMESCL